MQHHQSTQSHHLHHAQHQHQQPKPPPQKRFSMSYVPVDMKAVLAEYRMSRLLGDGRRTLVIYDVVDGKLTPVERVALAKVVAPVVSPPPTIVTSSSAEKDVNKQEEGDGDADIKPETADTLDQGKGQASQSSSDEDDNNWSSGVSSPKTPTSATFASRKKSFGSFSGGNSNGNSNKVTSTRLIDHYTQKNQQSSQSTTKQPTVQTGQYYKLMDSPEEDSISDNETTNNEAQNEIESD